MEDSNFKSVPVKFSGDTRETLQRVFGKIPKTSADKKVTSQFAFTYEMMTYLLIMLDKDLIDIDEVIHWEELPLMEHFYKFIIDHDDNEFVESIEVLFGAKELPYKLKRFVKRFNANRTINREGIQITSYSFKEDISQDKQKLTFTVKR